MTVKTYNPDDEQRRERIISEVTTILGAKGTADLLLDGDPEMGVEPLPDGHRATDILRNALEDPEDGLTKVTLNNVVKDVGAVNRLEQWLVGSEERRIQNRLEHGVDRARAVEQAMNGLPGWLAQDLLQREVDRLEGGASYDDPDRLADLLCLKQVEAEWFGKGKTRQERINVWDDLLKFSRYEVSIWYNGGDKKFTRSRWCRQSSAAHNRVLRELRRRKGEDTDVDRAETNVKKLYQPPADPLEDIEVWIDRWT